MRGRSQNSLGLWSDWSTPDAGGDAGLLDGADHARRHLHRAGQRRRHLQLGGVHSIGPATPPPTRWSCFRTGIWSTTSPARTPKWGLTDQYSCATWTLQVRALGNVGEWSDWSAIDANSTVQTCPTS